MHLVRTSVCLLVCASLVAAQGSQSDDAAVLLALKANGNNAQAHNLRKWDAGGDPCGANFDDAFLGWYGVQCCAAYDSVLWTGCQSQGESHTRVTWLRMSHWDGISGDVALLGPLTSLVYLDISYTGFSGNVVSLAHLHSLLYLDISETDISGLVASFAGMSALTTLSLYQCAAVGGDVASLEALSHLNTLELSKSGCYGDSSGLRSSIPSLDTVDFDFCSSNDDACPSGRTPVANPDTYIGSNECACCSGTQKFKSDTGACTAPPTPSPSTPPPKPSTSVGVYVAVALVSVVAILSIVAAVCKLCFTKAKEGAINMETEVGASYMQAPR